MQKAVDLIVKFTRRQAINFTGKTLRSVAVRDNILVIHRKMYRGRFAICYYPLEKVIAYQEGEGGKDGNAYAIVVDEVVLKMVQGKGIIDEFGLIKIVDEDSRVHYMNSIADDQIIVSIIEADEESEKLPVKRKKVTEPDSDTEEPEDIDNAPIRTRRIQAEPETTRSVGRPKTTNKVNRASDWDDAEITPKRRSRNEF